MMRPITKELFESIVIKYNIKDLLKWCDVYLKNPDDFKSRVK